MGMRPRIDKGHVDSDRNCQHFSMKTRSVAFGELDKLKAFLIDKISCFMIFLIFIKIFNQFDNFNMTLLFSQVKRSIVLIVYWVLVLGML
jgi:hypothetical protein